jgi:hypothetical protein
MTFKELDDRAWASFLDKFREDPKNLQTEEMRETAALDKVSVFLLPGSRRAGSFIPMLSTASFCVLFGAVLATLWLSAPWQANDPAAGWKIGVLWFTTFVAMAVDSFVGLIVVAVTIGVRIVKLWQTPAPLPQRKVVPAHDYIFAFAKRQYDVAINAIGVERCEQLIGRVEIELGEVNTVLVGVTEPNFKVPAISFSVESLVGSVQKLSGLLMELYRVQETFGGVVSESTNRLEEFKRRLQTYSAFETRNALGEVDDRSLESMREKLASEVEVFLAECGVLGHEVSAVCLRAEAELTDFSSAGSDSALHLSFLKTYTSVMERSHRSEQSGNPAKREA